VLLYPFLQVDLNQAMALSLLLLLKRYLKMLYSLSDERCQAYSPTEAVRSIEQVSRRDAVGPFDHSLIDLVPTRNIRDLWERYKVSFTLLHSLM
jgi:cohesin loading factor subunit SCC2